jgi:hypothetical protein
MSSRANALPITPAAEFAKKIAKLTPVMAALNTATLASAAMRLSHALNIDYKSAAVRMLRGTCYTWRGLTARCADSLSLTLFSSGLAYLQASLTG